MCFKWCAHYCITYCFLKHCWIVIRKYTICNFRWNTKMWKYCWQINYVTLDANYMNCQWRVNIHDIRQNMSIIIGNQLWILKELCILYLFTFLTVTHTSRFTMQILTPEKRDEWFCFMGDLTACIFRQVVHWNSTWSSFHATFVFILQM